MIEIPYFISTNSNGWRVEMANQLAKQLNTEVYMDESEIRLSNDIASGSSFFKELENGLALWVSNYIFYESVTFKLQPVPNNDYYYLLYNMGNDKFIFEYPEPDSKSTITKVVEENVLISCSGIGINSVCPPNKERKFIMIIFTRNWILKNIDIQQFPHPVDLFSTIRNGMNIVRTGSMTKEIEFICNTIQQAKIPVHIQRLYYRSLIYQLLFTHIIQLVKNPPQVGNNKSFELIQSFKNSLENLKHCNYPLIEEAAKKCLMSKTNFSKLFKAYYDITYSDFCIQCKMKKAADMLQQGFTVADAGNLIGYSNIGHFANAFKNIYNTTPKQYQIQLRKQERIYS